MSRCAPAPRVGAVGKLHPRKRRGCPHEYTGDPPHLSMPRTPTPQPAARRVDAERNRDRILGAARAAFADPDADVSMAEISRRAGVGSATLYRNFASRRDLLEALYIDEIDAVCQAASTITGDNPEEIFVAWLRRFYAYFTSKRFVAAALLEHADRDDPVFGAGYARVLSASRPLLRAAQRSGEIRTDLTLEQILDMVAAVAKIPGDAGYREPILRAALDALRPASPG
jgi:AcrR family transcriptional regulator